MTAATSATGDVIVAGSDGRQAPAIAIDLGRLCELAAEVLLVEGITTGHLDLHLVDVDDMADLNQEHLGHEGPTDVLSFPIDGGVGPDDIVDRGPVDQTGFSAASVLLGDVVLCPEVAARQAAEHVGDLVGEMQLLVIHGVLHILGHDHAEPGETELMQDRERLHLERQGVAHPGQQ